MAGNYYQIGPLFDIFIHLYPVGTTSPDGFFLPSGYLTPNEGGGSFRPTVGYLGASIPEEVPYSRSEPDGVMRPPGYKKGDKYQSNKKTDFLNDQNDAFFNPFVIGWGYRIGDAFWVEIEYPFGFPDANVTEALKLRPLPSEGSRRHPGNYGTPESHDRYFVWAISLQFDVVSGVKPPQLPAIPPPKTQEARVAQTFNGGPIPYSKGARAIDGVVIWIKGVEAGDADIGETSIGTWAVAFGEPLHPGEEIYLNQLWFDGNLAWSLDDGVVLEGLGDDFAFTFYQGSETQEPDPDIVEDKGETRTPAHLGLIYMVLKDVQLAPVGNRLPQTVRAEILPSDNLRISVAETIEDIGVLGDVTIEVSGIDDEADGYGPVDEMDPRAELEKYRDIYGYMIVDGDPVRVIRRPINDDLTVDIELAADDFSDTGADDPVVVLERKDDSSLPNQVTLNYIDKSQNYERRPQYGRLPKFPVQATVAKKKEAVDTDFSVTASEAVRLAHDILYRKWAEKLCAEFSLQPKRSEIEEADVTRVPTAQGQWLMQIERRTLEPDQTVKVRARYLLAERGANLNADAGDLAGTVARPCYYPQMLQGIHRPIIITGDRIWSWARCTHEFGDPDILSAAGTNIPTKLSRRYEAEYPFDDATSPGTDLVADADYVYSIHNSTALGTSPETYSGPRIMRANKLLPSEVTSLICPDLRVDNSVGLSNGVQSAVLNGFLYIASAGYAEAGGGTSPFLLWRIDLADFSEDAVSTIDLTDVTPVMGQSRYMSCVGMCAAGGKVLISTVTANSSGGIIEGRIFSYYPPDETITEDVTTYLLGLACSDQEFGYFLPNTAAGTDDAFHDFTQVHGAKVNAATMDVEYFDITEDPNVIISDAFNRPWSDGESLNFVTNNSTWVDDYVNQPYLAKRSLSDLSVVTGRDLTLDHDNVSYRLYAGASNGTYSYIKGVAFSDADVRRGPGCILKVDKGSNYAVFYPARQSPPNNDDFPGIAIGLAQTKTFYNEFATKEEDEPDHNGDEGGKSQWWTFTAPTDGFYVVSAPLADNFAVYTGATLATITDIGSSDGNPIKFTGTAGQKYRIAIDGHFDPDTLITSFREGAVTVTQETAPPNDNFANAANIAPPQTKTARNQFATKEVGEPDHAGNAGGKSLWWKYTPSEDTNLRVSTSGSDFPTLLAVYVEGSPAGVGGLVEIDSDAETGGTDDDYASWMPAL